ncbi:MAG: DJ-1/PfpI family protein [Oscillospiraceae bacterium]|nr:DJ-1/PfpI family protein [Oscillospiraceae bacterium]MDD7292604.1 DJ-1/PfpI family protein [Clostridiaceae bacterium]MDY5990791.1 DJ-1 family glyoxalase III [Oscillospiraceae bacterium]
MVYCFLADGFEETEAIAPVDMLRRAGVTVKTVGIGKSVITGSHGISVICDLTDSEMRLTDELDGVILPGGMPGTLNLDASQAVHSAVDFAVSHQKLVCAICAAPSILGRKGLLSGKKAIAFPGFEKELEGAIISKDPVVKDGVFITAKGAGVAVDFGLEIVAALVSRAKSDEIRSSIQCR